MEYLHVQGGGQQLKDLCCDNEADVVTQKVNRCASLMCVSACRPRQRGRRSRSEGPRPRQGGQCGGRSSGGARCDGGSAALARLFAASRQISASAGSPRRGEKGVATIPECASALEMIAEHNY